MAYRADIEIAVRGAQELKRLQDQVSATSKLVDTLNNYLENIGTGGVVRSINNLTTVVNEAANAFSKAALDTEDATIAATRYVEATSKLNAGLRERSALLEKINREQRAAALVRAGVQMPAQQLLLPAAAPGSPAMSGGARSLITGPVERLGGARTSDEAAAALRLAQNIEQQVRPLSQIKALYAGIATETARMQSIKALPDTAMLNAASRGIQSLETAENKYNRELQESATRLQLLDRLEASRERRAEKLKSIQSYNQPSVPSGGTQPPGPTKPKGGLGFNRNPTKENLALGVGFPLLMGGGAGQLAGGLAGSFYGEGFGGQIFGSGIGQQLEDAQRRIAEIGKATQTLNMDALRDSAITVTAELTNQVRLLEEAGNADAARAAIAQQVTTQTGLVPEAVSDITNNVGLLSNTWDEFVGAVSATLAIIGTPFVSALTVIFQGLAKALQLVNLYYTVTGGIVKRVVEIGANYLGLGGLLDKLKTKTTAINEEEQKRVAALQALTDKQSTEIKNGDKLLQLESQRQAGRTLAEKAINADIDKRIANNKIIQDYEQKAKDISVEHGKVTTEAGKRKLELALANNTTLAEQALRQQAIKDSLTQQGIAIEANTEKYNVAATAVQNQIAALDRGNQVTQSRFGVELALNDLYGAQLQRQYELARTDEQRFNIAIRMFHQQVNAAKIEYQQALVNNQLLIQKAELETKLTEIKYKQLEADKAIALAGAKSRGATPAILNELAAGYDKGLALQQDVVNESYKQLQATAQIAANQNQVADAVFKTKLIQAESQLAQKLASDEIGMSKQAADNLAGALAVGVRESHTLSGAMSDVAAEAHNASLNIMSAFHAQQQLNQSRSTATGAPIKVKGAAAGAYWPGGFKAFAQGGMVTKPTLGLIGEGGQPEYIVPESKAQNFAMNYLMGARGAAAIPRFAEGGYTGNANVSIQTGPVTQMNGANYVTTQQMSAAVKEGIDQTMRFISRDMNIRRSMGIA